MIFLLSYVIYICQLKSNNDIIIIYLMNESVYLKTTFLFLFSAIFMFVACVIYPRGWNDPKVTDICGSGADEYRLGLCGIRWAYILAILGIFDAAILAILAFFLASKRATIDIYSTTGTVTKCKQPICFLSVTKCK